MEQEDVGIRLVNHVFRIMRIDEEWSITEERGFTWWGHRLSQRVWAEVPRMHNNTNVVAVHAETAFLRNVKSGFSPGQKTAVANRYSSLSALISDHETERVYWRCSAYIHDQVEPWIQPLFASAVAIQAEEAHFRVDELRENIGGDIDESEHPESGIRKDPDEMLSIVTDFFLPQGMGSSPFREDEFQAVANMEPSPAVMATYDPSGLTAEVPFSGVEPAALSAMSPTAEGPSTALFQASSGEGHQYLGSGCRIQLVLPLKVDDHGTPAGINLAEAKSWTGYNLFGGWYWANESLIFGTFIPSAAYRRGLLSLILWNAAGKAKWFYDEFMVK
jgi:hypothetical protein